MARIENGQSVNPEKPIQQPEAQQLATQGETPNGIPERSATILSRVVSAAWTAENSPGTRMS